MKANRFVKECGPFYVTSHSQGEGLVYARIYPAFPEYNIIPEPDTDEAWQKEPRWAPHRFHGDGGGPSIFASMAFGTELTKFLNAAYDESTVKEWETIITRLLEERDKHTVIKECGTCATVSSVPREYKFCPVCGNRLTQERPPKSAKAKAP